MKQLLFFLILLASLPVKAGTPPLPERKTEALGVLQERLVKEKDQKAVLKKELEVREKALEKTKSALVKTARSIRKNERELQTLELRIADLTQEQNQLTARLKEDYGSISALILALQRIRRIPPESLIFRPGAPLKTAQTAMLLQSILPTVNQRARDIGNDLDRLETIRKTRDEDRQTVLNKRKNLDKNYGNITAVINKRERLYKRTNEDYEKTAAAVERISRESKNLQDLMNRLKKEEKMHTAAQAWQQYVIPRKGMAQLPVTGIITTGYGEKDNIGAVHKGLTLETAPNALATAPMGGIVRFAGVFKNYGQMIIIEHQNNYHSLLAGLGKIDTVVGQRVKAGEPIGRLPPASSRGDRPALYYELRHKGKPVDPVRQFRPVTN